MAKFVSVCSLAFVVILILGGCATPQGGSATQQGGRYDWLNLEKYKKPSEKEVAKKPGLFDWLKPKPEEKKEVAAKEPRRYKWREPEETKEVAKKPGLFDWLKRKPEEKKEATAEAGPYEPPKPEEKKEVTEEARPYEPPRPKEKKVVAEKPGRYDWLKTEPEEEEEEEEERAPLGEPGDLDLKIDYWMTEGEQAWSIIVAGWELSELVFPVDTDFVVLTGEYRFAERWSADISYGFGDIDKGTTTDSDWMTFGNPARSHLADFNNTTGEASFWMADLYCRLWTHNRSYLDAFLGFQHNENSFRMRDGRWVIYNYVPDTSAIVGLDMRYEGEFQAIRLGFRAETPIARNPEWTLEGSVAYLPWVEAEGRGFWNLRTDPASPYQVGMHIKQQDGQGDGIDAYVAVNYRPAKRPNLTLELGYRFMELRTSGGTTQNYWTEGTYVTPSDWKNMCRFQGFFFGLAYRF